MAASLYKRCAPLQALFPELHELAVVWRSIREECLQTATLRHLPEAVTDHLREVLEAAYTALDQPETHSTDVWRHSAWQLAVLQLLALAGSDFVHTSLQPSQDKRLTTLHLCTQLLSCVARTDALYTSQQAHRALACLHLTLARMELPHLLASMVLHARHAFEDKEADRAYVSYACATVTALACMMLELQLGFVTYAQSLPCDAAGGLVLSATSQTLLAVADSHILEHVARILLPLAEAKSHVAAGADSDLRNPDTGDLPFAFCTLDQVLQQRLDDGPCSGTSAGVGHACKEIIHTSRQRMLGGPCLQAYLAARLSEVLHALDRGGRAGLPPCAWYPPECSSASPGEHPTGRDIATHLQYVRKMLRLLVQARVANAQQAAGSAGTAHGHGSVCASSIDSCAGGSGCVGDSRHCGGGGDGSCDAPQGAPLSADGMCRLSLRALRLATGIAGSSGSCTVHAPSTSAQAGTPGGGNVPNSATQPPLPVPLPLAMPHLAGNYQGARQLAAAAVDAAISALDQCKQRRPSADACACEVLQHVIALVYAAANDSSASASSSGRIWPTDGAVAKLVAWTLRKLRSEDLLVDDANDDDAAPRLEAAVRVGLLLALQACVAWLIGYVSSQRTPGQLQLSQKLLDVMQLYSARAALLAPERQAAALAVAMRSGVARLRDGWRAKPDDPAFDSARSHTIVMSTGYSTELRDLAAEPTRTAASGRVAAFALRQWAVVMGPAAQDMLHITVSTGTTDGAVKVIIAAKQLWCMASRVLQAFTNAKRAADDAAAAVADRAASLRAAASWRALLLRDMHLLDSLACALHGAARSQGVDGEFVLMLDVLELASYALPEEVQQHVAAGQAAARGRAPQPSAAGRGPMWLTADKQARDLLGPSRCNRPQLLRILGARSASGGSAAAQQARVDGERLERLLANVAPLGLPPPCDAAIMDTCAHPGCDSQVYAAAAARLVDTLPLRACARCGEVCYCSKACQEVHWREWHKAECGKGWWQAV